MPPYSLNSDKMMTITKDFSVIVPVWRGAVKYLPKLIYSIPETDSIEIIVIDNSKEPVLREEIECSRDFVFLHSAPNRHAGGSRNDGIAAAKGKWLLFADADDYFTEDAFDVFYSHFNSNAELIYTKPEGRYEDTGEHSDRGDFYASLVHGYCEGYVNEEDMRLNFGTPWCKMISHELVRREKLSFDEIRACNDIYFSLTCGYYANSIEADDRVTYIVTVNHGSLTQHRDYEVMKARLIGKMHCNRFLKDHGLGKRQRSIMFAFSEARHFGIGPFFEMLGMIIKARQNPFVGISHWRGTAKASIRRDERHSQYLVK